MAMHQEIFRNERIHRKNRQVNQLDKAPRFKSGQDGDSARGSAPRCVLVRFPHAVLIVVTCRDAHSCVVLIVVFLLPAASCFHCCKVFISAVVQVDQSILSSCASSSNFLLLSDESAVEKRILLVSGESLRQTLQKINQRP